jgi:hypothetical protein
MFVCGDVVVVVPQRMAVEDMLEDEVFVCLPREVEAGDLLFFG